MDLMGIQEAVNAIREEGRRDEPGDLMGSEYDRGD